MSRARMDVLIMTALKEELDAVLGLEVGPEDRGTWKLLRDRHGFPYHVREFQNAFGEALNVAAAWSGEMGESTAAGRAASLVDELEPECLAMCGICAGKRGKVFLGDVIVADRVFSYDHGKLIAGTPEEGGGFFHDITTYNLEATWRMEAAYFAQEFLASWRPALARPVSKETQERWLLLALQAHEQQGGPPPDRHPRRKEYCPGWGERIQELRQKGLLETTVGVLRLTEQGKAWVAEALLLDPDGQSRDPDFRVHVASMATGKAVREDPELFRRLERHMRKALGIEMEGAAIGQISERLGRRSIIAKAVSDYGDHDKDDAFREFACHASAAFLLAFLGKYMRAREPGAQPVRIEPALRGLEGRREEFLGRIERATLLREPPGTQLVRVQGSPPFETYIEVTVREGKFPRIHPVGALDQPITREVLEDFIRDIHLRYQWENPLVISTLVHVGQAASPELARLAEGKRINLLSFAEYQGLLDFSEYIHRQTERLEHDALYPPDSYVEQRGKVSIGGQAPVAVEDVLKTIREMLNATDPRFALILGEFGTGKTFLLHELARRMGQEEDAALIPVLIEMRALQKQRTLRELIAQHFAPAEVPRFDVDKFLYMLREGRIVLLFDGFDELALRVTYDQVMEHFRTLIEAAEGKAKVVVTSRTQHFLTDHDLKRELAQRAESLPGYRLLKLERFHEEQIRQFLEKRLGSEAAAAERLELLRDVRDLLGLSENPRLLSFIVELDVEKLNAARAGLGEITSAKLYELLIDKWLQGEYDRVNPRGAPKGLSVRQLQQGAIALALLLWARTERTVSMSELPAELLEAVNAQGEHSLETEKVRHQLGSGSLLVRDEDGRFTFVHQSVMEWLVAEHVAKEVREKGDTFALGQHEMSTLMADFFIALAGREVALSWAERKVGSAEDEGGKRNALLVLGRFSSREPFSVRVPLNLGFLMNFEGNDLRGQDLSKADLRQADLRNANLSGVPLVEADLSGACLEGASLVRAELDRANLRGADLTGTDLTGARLLKADLRGAKLEGTKLRMARLTGALVDSLGGCDVFGAALPDQVEPEPQLVTGSASTTVCFSPVDELLAIGHEDGTIHLWNSTTGAALRVFKGHVAPVGAIAFSPKGELLASASDNGTVRLWSVEGASHAHRVLQGHLKRVLAVCFSPDGTIVASASEDASVRLWNVADGQVSAVFGNHSDAVLAVTFSPDGAILASASKDATVSLWSMKDQTRRVLQGSVGAVSGIAFSSDGASLVAASLDGTLMFWDMAEMKEPRVLRGHVGAVSGLALSPDGTTLATACQDTTVALWTLAEKPLVRTLSGHANPVLRVGFSPDGAMLASVSSDGTVRLWSVAEGHSLRVLEGGKERRAVSIAFISRETLVCASDDASLELWNVEKGEFLRKHEVVAEDFLRRSFAQGGAHFVVVTPSGTIQIWDVITGRMQRTIEDRLTRQVVLNPDGTLLAAVSKLGDVTLWGVRTGERLAELEGHKGSIVDLAFSPDGQVLAGASRDGNIWLWSVSSGLQLGALQGHRDAVWSIDFSPDGGTLVSCSADQSIRFWDVGGGRLLRAVKDPRGISRRVRFGPQGKSLVAQPLRGALSVLRAEDGRILSTFKGHSANAWNWAFNPDGVTVAVAYEDGVVGIHDVASGNCMARLLRFSEGWVALRSDGRFKSEGNTTAAFWFTLGLCRFDPDELSSVLTVPWRIPDGEPLFPKS